MIFRKEGGIKVKKLLILTIAVTVLLFSFSIANAGFYNEYPESVMVIPYFNATSGFQTFVLVHHQDTDDWGQDDIDPNVYVKFNPKCGRGQTRSVTLTTKQSFVVTPPQPIEGWVEIFAKNDISDNPDDDQFSGDFDANGQGWGYPLTAMAVVLDIANGVSYGVEGNGYWNYLCADVADEPLFYGWDCDGGNQASSGWGWDWDDPITARLWRNSDNGRTMVVLCDPSGRHLDTDIPVPTGSGWLPSDLYVPNKAQLDIYSKSETDAHLSVEWCTGDDAGKPGIVTIGVGTTDGPLGTTDTSIANPAPTMTDAPYGFGQAYNLRVLMWVESVTTDGLMQPGEQVDESHLLGAVLTRISNVYFPHATYGQNMFYKYY